MSKRYFRIDLSGYGGELVLGHVNPDFVEYWQERDQEDLVTHLIDMEDDAGDPDSPPITPDGNRAVYELGNLEHHSGVYSDNGFWVTEISVDDPEQYAQDGGARYLDYTTDIGEQAQHDFARWVYTREAYSSFSADDDHIDDADQLEPVVCWHSSEKGVFGWVIVETDGADFDPELLGIGVVETDTATLVTDMWYNGEHLDVTYDGDTRGKGIYASVGYIYRPWYDAEYGAEELDQLVQEAYAEE
jgi:hypothetical protein